MEGLRRGRKPPLQLERGFASSRLEPQILMRVYELVVPIIRRGLGGESPPVAERELTDCEVLTHLTKGA